jgi:uncharacterized protein YprB with RNaseH-like and TPR domain
VLAEDMVSRRLAKRRDEIDENNGNEILKEWQKEKNPDALRKIFGRPQLTEPDKDLLS